MEAILRNREWVEYEDTLFFRVLTNSKRRYLDLDVNTLLYNQELIPE
jgi:hypothetical protein